MEPDDEEESGDEDEYGDEDDEYDAETMLESAVVDDAWAVRKTLYQGVKRWANEQNVNLKGTDFRDLLDLYAGYCRWVEQTLAKALPGLASAGQSWQSLPFMVIGVALMLLGAQLLLG